jgi:hypothetical protein
MACLCPQANKAIDDLVGHIPDTSTSEQDQLTRIAELQKECNAAGDRLREEIMAAEMQQARAQDLFAVLADAKLAAKSKLTTEPEVPS